MKLWKTTVVVWSDFNPDGLTLEELARDADSGESYCARMESVPVLDAESDPDWDGTDFFLDDDGDDNDE